MRRMCSAALILGLTAIAGAGCAPMASQGPSARDYLLQAPQAVEAHQADKALSAINNAQNAYLAANPTRPPNETEEPPALRAFGRASDAVKAQQWGPAEQYINTAMDNL